MKFGVSLLLVGLLSVSVTYAQRSFRLIIQPADTDTVFINKMVSYHKVTSDSVSRLREMNRVLNQLYLKGYLTASFNRLTYDTSRLTALLTVGGQYKWLQLKNGNVDESILSHIHYREKLFSGKPVNYNLIGGLFEQMLEYLENNGYPFAEVKLDSFQFEGSLITAGLYLKKNQLVSIDSIVVYGDVMIIEHYLYNYLGIKKGSLYNESMIRNISVRLLELPFLEEESPFNVVFVKDKARINLYLKRKKASKFNFIIGFLPNAQGVTPTEKSKLLVTGDASLNLQNPFGGGDELNVKWRRYKANTQSLKAKFLYPYLPLVPFGLDLNLEIYRYDTIYIERTLGFGFQYMFIGNDYLKAYVSNKTSRLISINELAVMSSNRLPNNIDINYNLYGLEYNLERLDYRLNPRKGFTLNLNGGLGEKQIIKNDEILFLSDPLFPEFNGKSLYDSVKLKTIQYRVTYNIEKYWRIRGRSTIKTALAGGGFVAENIFLNEVFRIGGTKLLRGFDEESVLVSLYNVFTLEYRLLTSRNSYFYVFGDGGYLENQASKANPYDWPLGIGTGMTFETKAGIFTISYAIGRQMDQPGSTFDFRYAKIHFGYLNYF